MSNIKAILVSGASSGIGLYLSRKLISEGFIVYGLCRTNPNLDSPLFNFIQCDFTDLDAFDKNYFAQIDSLDAFVHCAGVQYFDSISNFKLKNMINSININSISFLIIVKFLIKLKKLKINSSIISLSSIANRNGEKGLLSYSCSKGLLESATRVLSNELTKFQVRVNCISLGMLEHTMAGTEHVYTNENLRRISELYPRGFGSNDDIIELIKFLIDERSKWISGQIYNLDGGKL